MLKDVIREEFEDTKGAIRIRISKKKRQQKKYYVAARGVHTHY
jgi:hypothetical protein